jgi:WASH complex subunit 7
MIVPALTINFIDNLLIAKEKLGKAKANDMYFTDDGFSLGVAYILRVLKQSFHFDCLNWFKSVGHKLV